MSRLYEITEELRKLFDEADAYADEHEGELPAELAASLKALETDLTQKLAGCCSIRSESLSTIEMLDKEIERLQKRKKAQERKVVWMQDYMQDSLTKLGLTELEVAGKWKLRLQKTPGAVRVTDSTLIPSSYVEVFTERKVNKVAISAVLKKGEEVPGCELVSELKLRVY